MPPSGHSHSSHSSRSHSSHSSSHHSSHHSSSSHSSRSYSSSSGRSTARTVTPSFTKKRVNQPTGFKDIKRVGYLGRNHEYVYYDQDFVNEETGVSYEKGYYDENGNFYKQVAFKDKDGLFSADFLCQYCGTTAKLKWQTEIVPKCPNCSAALDVVHIPTDELRTAPYRITSAIGGERPQSVKTILLVFAIIFISMCTICCGCGTIVYSVGTDEVSEEIAESFGDESETSNTDIYGTVLYLKNTADGEYVLSDSEDYTMKMKWDYGADSYYDRDSDCYVWYNTNVAPNLWQYWYEDISSNYGDYGWMEYEDTTDNGINDGIWYIETSEGNWEELPEEYLSDRLWHITEED